MGQDIKFTALFVKNVQDLLKRFPPKHKKIFGDHSTIEYEAKNLNNIEIGKKYPIKIIGRAYDEFGDDLLVDNVKSKNKYPHITLSRGENAPSLYSEVLFEKSIASKKIEYFDNEEVEVIEGYSDSKNHIKRDTESAFKWIIGILQKHKIPFQIKGGLASILYGVKRELADIDISIPENSFDELFSDVKDFIKYGPDQYLDDEWDIKLITLKYKGQNIDIAGAFDKKNFDKKNNKWVNTPSNFDTSVYMDVYGLNVPVISKEDLLSYKKLILRDVDIFDIETLNK